MHSMDQASSDAGRRLLADAARAGREVPPLASLLAAFVPVLAAQADLREQAPGWQGPLPVPDPERFTKGAFVLAGGSFQEPGPLLNEAAMTLLPVMAGAFPGLTLELSALGRALAEGGMSAGAFYAAAFGEPVPAPAGVSAETLGFAAAQMLKPFLERQARDLHALVADLPWMRGMCPVCGGAPNFSQLVRIRDDSEYIQAHGGQRRLRCGTCATQWRYKRVSCPGCGNENPKELFHLQVAARPYERVDLCRKCKAACLCLDTMELVDVPDPAIAALLMLPLELEARAQGFTPLAGQAWHAVF